MSDEDNSSDANVELTADELAGIDLGFEIPVPGKVRLPESISIAFVSSGDKKCWGFIAKKDVNQEDSEPVILQKYLDGVEHKDLKGWTITNRLIAWPRNTIVEYSKSDEDLRAVDWFDHIASSWSTVPEDHLDVALCALLAFFKTDGETLIFGPECNCI